MTLQADLGLTESVVDTYVPRPKEGSHARSAAWTSASPPAQGQPRQTPGALTARTCARWGLSAPTAPSERLCEKEWQHIAPELHRLNLLTVLDLSALAEGPPSFDGPGKRDTRPPVRASPI